MKSISFILYIHVSLFFLVSGCENIDPIDNARSYFIGEVVDINGEPLNDVDISIEQDFERILGTFTTDENGKFEGAGFVYGGSFNVNLPEYNNLSYNLSYSDFISGISVEIPRITLRDGHLMTIDIINNSGNELNINYEFTSGYCDNIYVDNVLQPESNCFEIVNQQINRLNSASELRLFVLIDSEVIINVTDGTNTIQETFINNSNQQVETIIFN
jgi:hypothetical protein